MDKYVKVILSVLFAMILYGMTDNFSADQQVESQRYALVCKAESQELSSAQLPYLPEGELTSAAQSHQVVTPRVQRASFLEYSLLLKSLMQKLSVREGALSQHWGRIYDTTTSYKCHSVSDYYVFALRRIII